jgi:deoxyribose-phosphate aldolase
MVDSLARYIDHTLLRPTATLEDIQRLCGEAAAYHFAAVCVFPAHVPIARKALSGSAVKIAAVSPSHSASLSRRRKRSSSRSPQPRVQRKPTWLQIFRL